MNVYDFNVKDGAGEDVSLKRYEGQVLLIVNTASKWGFTPQLDGLEELFEAYGPDKFHVLAFPCNQFANQEPGTQDEIKTFCQVNFGIEFPIFQKIDVNGENADPLYVYLRENTKSFLGNRIKWNFTKFLVDSRGVPVKRYAPKVEPKDLVKDIEALLK